MKRFFFFVGITLVAFGLTACTVKFSDKSEKSKKKVEKMSKMRLDNLKPFEEIEVMGAFDVFYTQGTTTAVNVEAAESIKEKLDIKSDGKTLSIKMENDLLSMFKNSRYGDVKVYITSPDLTKISVAGSSDFDVRGKLDTDELKSAVAGSGEIHIPDLICNRLKVEVAGSGEVDVKKVTCDRIKAEIAGSGDIDLEHVVANEANLSIAGSGDIDMEFINGGLVDVSIAGSGDVELKGAIKSLKKSVAGSGNITTKNLRIIK